MNERLATLATASTPEDSAFTRPEGFFPLRLVVNPDGNAVDLDRPNMLLGRHSDADVRLPTPDVSRRHCRFVFTEEGWEVFDLNSLNGLFVNGERVQQMVLHHRDLVAVGGYRLQVDLSHPHATLAPESENDASDRVLESIALALPATGVRQPA